MKHELETIKFGVIPIVNYKNCIVEKIIGGYKILGKIVTTPEEVDEVIEGAKDNLKTSLKPSVCP